LARERFTTRVTSARMAVILAGRRADHAGEGARRLRSLRRAAPVATSAEATASPPPRCASAPPTSRSHDARNALDRRGLADRRRVLPAVGADAPYWHMLQGSAVIGKIVLQPHRVERIAGRGIPVWAAGSRLAARGAAQPRRLVDAWR
jgi:hypothetical protein